MCGEFFVFAAAAAVAGVWLAIARHHASTTVLSRDTYIVESCIFCTSFRVCACKHTGVHVCLRFSGGWLSID